VQETETRIPDLKEQTYHPIEDYGVIGDLRTAALVGPNGSIDMLCWPRFDSPSIFCALVDHEKGGRFQIVPLLTNARQLRLYLPDTNILLSRFLSDDGVAEVSDFMFLTDDAASPQALVRRAKCVRGEVRFRVTCAPRFDYARADHRIERQGNAVVFVSAGLTGPPSGCAAPSPCRSMTARRSRTSACAPGRRPPSCWNRRGRPSPLAIPTAPSPLARSSRRRITGGAGSAVRSTRGGGARW
jgi:hypothetical protein